MSEMIERVAAAIAVCGIRQHIVELSKAEASALARSAIEEMREPTKQMYRKAADECSTTDLSCSKDFELLYADVWEVMIDAALGEKVDA